MSFQPRRLPATGLLALLAVSGPIRSAEDTTLEAYADLRLRGETISSIPGERELDRARLHGYLGLRWFPGPQWELGAALKASAGSDDNRDNVRNLDNEESNELELGEAYLRFFAGENATLEAGRSALPLSLSGMLWDRDLRPSGVSVQRDFQLRSFDRLRFTAGWFSGLHIDDSDSELLAAQAQWRILEGAPRSATITLGYLKFDDLQGLIEDGRGRTNAVSGGDYLNDFELLNLTLGYRWLLPFGPLTAELDLVDNLDAGDQDQGARFRVALGDATQPGGWEFGYAVQRIQREAVVAAFNEDDWWFPSNMRGFMPWVSYGVNELLKVRLAGFRERRDDRREHLKRLQLDFLFTY